MLDLEVLLQAAFGRKLTVYDLEREYIKFVLAAEHGNKTTTAEKLGLDRKTLYRKLSEYDEAEHGAQVDPRQLTLPVAHRQKQTLVPRR